MQLQMITAEDVLMVHEALADDFAESNDPISPPGVRDQGLLESAVSRQWTSSGDQLKYPEPLSNSATLLYGICNNHPFYNGNKRTALVSMLVHLDKNKFSLFDTRQDELYSMILEVANHTIGLRIDPRKKGQELQRRSSDEEVVSITRWLRNRADCVERGERQITYRQLVRIIDGFGFTLKHPKGNSIDIIKYEEQKKGLLIRKVERVEKRIGSIPYPKDGAFVSIKVLKNLRMICRLREEDGIDSHSFYNQAAIIDAFVNRYRTILRKLARR